MKIVLDRSKLLGYRLGDANTGSKVGSKAGSKVGAKSGAKRRA